MLQCRTEQEIAIGDCYEIADGWMFEGFALPLSRSPRVDLTPSVYNAWRGLEVDCCIEYSDYCRVLSVKVQAFTCLRDLRGLYHGLSGLLNGDSFDLRYRLMDEDFAMRDRIEWTWFSAGRTDGSFCSTFHWEYKSRPAVWKSQNNLIVLAGSAGREDLVQLRDALAPLLVIFERINIQR